MDLESGLLLPATTHAGDAADGDSLLQTLIAAQANLVQAGSDAAIRDVPTDNCYHKNESLAKCDACGTFGGVAHTVTSGFVHELARSALRPSPIPSL